MLPQTDFPEIQRPWSSFHASCWRLTCVWKLSLHMGTWSIFFSVCQRMRLSHFGLQPARGHSAAGEAAFKGAAWWSNIVMYDSKTFRDAATIWGQVCQSMQLDLTPEALQGDAELFLSILFSLYHFLCVGLDLCTYMHIVHLLLHGALWHIAAQRRTRDKQNTEI